LNEDTVKAVMAQYFLQKNIPAHPTERGEKGPDFHIDGTVVEIKGDDFDSERMMKQLVTYAYREREVQLALPVEAFSAKLLVQLYVLGGVINDIRNKLVKLYLVTKLSEFYYVKEFYDVRMAVSEGLKHFMTVGSFVQFVPKPFGLKGKESDIEAIRVAESLARTVRNVDIAVRQLLIEAIKKQPYVMVHKNNVKVPRPKREESYWEI
jgi:hypothetical protein